MSWLSWQTSAMTSPDTPTAGEALAEWRRTLARARDKALQNLLITHEYAEKGRRAKADVAAGTAEAESTCDAVAAFDARYPHIRTTSNAEDDAEALRFMDRMTSY